MSEKAVEIQENWKPQCGDIFCFYGDPPILSKNPVVYKVYQSKEEGVVETDKLIPTELVRRFYKNLYIWLPRQDQLQGMVENHTWYGLILKLNQFVEEVDFSQEANEFRSMEQLWLAFVYRELYNKVWNGEDWITSISSRSDKDSLAV